MLEGMMYEGVDTVVLHNELAYHDILPVVWEALERAPDAFRLAGLEEANVLLLRACVAVEEYPARDKHEDLHPLAHELARLDFKLNLVLHLLANLAERESPGNPVPVQFNALGASWQAQGAVPALGECGLLRMRLRGSLPQSLDLYAQITENAGGGMSANFLSLTPLVTELVQQLCFLKHRKQVAVTRNSRNK
jgi:Atypical PilZ domain, cyclic di-GMP receptor